MERTTDLTGLITPAQYQSQRTTVFPSMASLTWFIRRNRQRIVAARALSKPAGRSLVEPVAFDRVVREVGQIASERTVGPSCDADL